jgi:hypothetical protein
MWGLYRHIVSSYISNGGILDDMIAQASVPLINFMVKAPAEFKTADFGGG